MWLTLGTTGNHTVSMECDPAEGERHLALVASAMSQPDMPGSIYLEPAPGVRVRVRLADVVIAELAEEQPK